MNTSSLFRDKTSLILRELMVERPKKWTVRGLADASNTSIGLVSRALNILHELGCAERGGKGKCGFTFFKEAERLLDTWTDHYRFSLNQPFGFYSPDESPVGQITTFLREKGVHHALTLHCGANLITNYFSLDQYHIYVETEDIEMLALEMSAKMILKRLARGGNIYFIKPYYKNSVYHRMQVIKGVNVVSSLQLYLDLYHFIPRGNEHAMYLRERLGKRLYE